MRALPIRLCSARVEGISLVWRGAAVSSARFAAFEDVCEPGEPALVDTKQYVAAFDQFAGGRDRWAAAVIAGPGPDVCSSDFGVAEPANRLLRFVNEVGDNAAFSSICAGDLAGALTDALDTFDAACQAFPTPE